jgi:hypothetical protein
MPDPLSSSEAYQSWIYALPSQFPLIKRLTLVYIPTGRLFGRVDGMLFFEQHVVLCVQEFLNFDLNVIEGYGYEVTRSHRSTTAVDFPAAAEYCQASYPHKDKLYWYDSFPHPHIPELASTDPHHKHIHPNIKQNRIPAPDLSFTRPNLPFLIEEVQSLLVENGSSL